MLSKPEYSNEKKEDDPLYDTLPDYEEIRKRRNRTNAFANYIGLSIEEMREGYARTRMKITPKMRNPIGSVHGGALYTTADVAGGAAAGSYDVQVTTLDSSIHYLRPGLRDCTELVGIGKVIKHGKRIIVTEIEIQTQTGKVLCTGAFTYMVLPKKS